MVSVTRFVFGSTRDTLLCSLLTTQMAPSSPRTQTGEPEGTVISAITLFVFGSILESTPFRSLSIQTLSALAVNPPSLFAGPHWNCGDHCVGFRIDAGKRLVRAVGHPDAAECRRQARTGTLADLDGCDDLIGLRIETMDGVLRSVGDPDAIVGHGLPVWSSLDRKHGYGCDRRNIALHSRRCYSGFRRPRWTR